MSYKCSNCGVDLAGMETCDCPVGKQAFSDMVNRSTRVQEKEVGKTAQDLWNKMYPNMVDEAGVCEFAEAYASSLLPETFYADRSAAFRFSRLVDNWKRAIRANQDTDFGEGLALALTKLMDNHAALKSEVLKLRKNSLENS